MATTAGTPDPARLVAFARTAAAQGAIDPLAKLADDRVFVFGGTLDPVVTPPVVSALQAFYREAGIAPERLQAKTDLAAGHTFATLGFGNGCGTTAPPFIGNCDYDLAGAILQQIYGPLQPPSEKPLGAARRLRPGRVPGGRRAVARHHRLRLRSRGLRRHENAAGSTSRSTAACEGASIWARWYATLTGYNRWADTNDLIVLYPQAVTTPTNPNGCWDWFAYDDPAFYAQSGRQMAAVKAMLERVLASCVRRARPMMPMIDFLHTLPVWAAGAILSSLSIGCGLLFVELVTRLVPHASRVAGNEVGGFMIAVVGTVYAVPLALIAAAAWGDYVDARSTVQREAAVVGRFAES